MSLLTVPARITSRLLGHAIDRLRPAAPAPPAELETPPGDPWIRGRVQELWCEPGKHHWARPAVRGRKPASCPDHR